MLRRGLEELRALRVDAGLALAGAFLQRIRCCGNWVSGMEVELHMGKSALTDWNRMRKGWVR